MVVQVTPIGWTARCVEHGELVRIVLGTLPHQLRDQSLEDGETESVVTIAADPSQAPDAQAARQFLAH